MPSTTSAFRASASSTSAAGSIRRAASSSHVVGYVDLDTKGIAGIEKYLDGQGAIYTASLADPSEHKTEPAQMSIDIRVQAA